MLESSEHKKLCRYSSYGSKMSEIALKSDQLILPILRIGRPISKFVNASARENTRTKILYLWINLFV